VRDGGIQINLAFALLVHGAIPPDIMHGEADTLGDAAVSLGGTLFVVVIVSVVVFVWLWFILCHDCCLLVV